MANKEQSTFYTKDWQQVPIFIISYAHN